MSLKQYLILFIVLLISSLMLACNRQQSKTKLLYFGFDDRSEKQQDVIQLSDLWSKSCPHWRATINKQEADYQILFGTAKVTVIDRRGEILYNGGQGVIYMAHGNPDGTGTDICKLTGQ